MEYAQKLSSDTFAALIHDYTLVIAILVLLYVFSLYVYFFPGFPTELFNDFHDPARTGGYRYTHNSVPIWGN